MRKKQVLFLPALLACTLLIAPIAAKATTLGLQLSSGGNTTTWCDDNISQGGCVVNGGNDTANPLLGDIQFAGSVGHWAINTGNGFGPPIESLPLFLDLSSFNATTSLDGHGANALTMLLTVTGLSGPLSNALGFFNHIGGTSSDGSTTITSQAWISSANTAFCGSGCGTAITSLISMTGQTFKGDGSGMGNTGAGPYSLTLQITIDANAHNQTSFDSELSQIPEPATLSVLGTGLLALGTGIRKRLLRA
jgi:hypothetical protein